MEIIDRKYVRAGIWAYKYPGFIWIAGERYFLYSMTEAIKRFRQKHKIRK